MITDAGWTGSTATYCYTTDGSAPAAATPGTCSAGTTYTVPFTVSATATTIKILSTLSGRTNSAVRTSTITLTVGDTTCTPTSGTYPISVSCSTATTTGATINTCNTSNSCTPATAYTGAFSQAAVNLGVQGVKSNYVSSTTHYYVYTAPTTATGCSHSLTLMGVGCGSTAGTCTAGVNDSALGGNSTNANLNETITNTTWAAQSFTINSGVTVTQWKLQISKAGGPTGNMTCSLYSDSSGAVGSEIAGTVVNVDFAAITTDVDAPFVLSPATVVSATSVWVACRNATSTSSTFWRLSNADVYASNGYADSANSGSTWSSKQTNDVFVTLYGCNP